MYVAPPTPPSRRGIWIRFLLYPTHTLPTAAAPVVVAAALAIQQQVFAPGVLLVAFLGSWLIHVGGVLADNHALLRRDRHVPEHPELLAALADGTLTLGQLRLVSSACFVLGAAPAPWLYSIGGPPVLVIGALGVASSLCYAATPLRYARLGLADPVFFVMFGVVAIVGCHYIQLASHAGPEVPWATTWARMPWQAWVLGMPVGALVTAVLVIDDIRDRDFDRAKGWSTTAVRFGLRGSRIEFVALLGFAFVAPLALWLCTGTSPWVLLPWVTLPEALVVVRAVLTRETTAELLAMTPRTSRLALLFAALQGAGLSIGT